MSEYTYNSQVAQSSEERLGSAASALSESIEQLEGQLKNLYASWTGTERDQYGEVHGKVSNGVASMAQTLGQIQAALGENTQSVTRMRGRAGNKISEGS